MEKILLASLLLTPFLGAFFASFAAKKGKGSGFAPVVVIAALETALAAATLFLPAAETALPIFGTGGSASGAGLTLGYGGFSSLYATVVSFMWLVASAFSPWYFRHERASAKYIFFWLWTLSFTVGLFLSRDLGSSFLFFEGLSLCSYAWVIEERTEKAFDAGKTYLAVAVFGGMVLFMGLALTYTALGTLRLDGLLAAAKTTAAPGKCIAGAICMLVGFGAKAGMFPLHIWLPKAHPVAPSPASAILSGALTKAGVFGVIVIVSKILYGHMAFGKALLLLGTVTMVAGAYLGVAATNLKRTLACSSVSQIGFILVGLGCFQILSSLGGEGAEAASAAAAGSLLHMVNHSLLKLLLFLLAGVVAAETGSLEFDEIRGYGRKKPLFAVAFLIGALGIGGVPFFNGYVSKTLLHEAIVETAKLTGNAGYTVIEWVFLLSGGMTLCYMAKLFTVLFIDRHPARQAEFDRKKDLCGLRGAALCAAALAVPAMGVLPLCRAAAKIALPFFSQGEEEISEALQTIVFSRLFSAESLSGAAISLAIGAFLFAAVVLGYMRRKTGYRTIQPRFLDMEAYFWKPLARAGLFLLHAAGRYLFCMMPERLFGLCLKVLNVCTAGLFFLSERFYGAVLTGLRLFGGIFQLPDGAILLSARWFNRERRPSRTLHQSAAAFAGRLEERFAGKAGEEKMRRVRYTLYETREAMLRSFTFAMAMTCLGLVLLLAYMLLL